MTTWTRFLMLILLVSFSAPALAQEGDKKGAKGDRGKKARQERTVDPKKELNGWAKQLVRRLGSNNPGIRNSAAAALASMGRPAVGPLRAVAEAKDDRRSKLANGILERINHRQRESAAKKENSRARKTEEPTGKSVAQRIKEAVDSGRITKKQGAERLRAYKKSFAKNQEKKKSSERSAKGEHRRSADKNQEAAVNRIKAAVASGKITEKEGAERLRAYKKSLAKNQEKKKSSEQSAKGEQRRPAVSDRRSERGDERRRRRGRAEESKGEGEEHNRPERRRGNRRGRTAEQGERSRTPELSGDDEAKLRKIATRYRVRQTELGRMVREGEMSRDDLRSEMAEAMEALRRSVIKVVGEDRAAAVMQRMRSERSRGQDRAGRNRGAGREGGESRERRSARRNKGKASGEGEGEGRGEKK